MAGKRTATSELNHDNWEDYEPEDAGSFKKAPEEVLQRRVIKTARRRNPISSVNDDGSAKNVFSSFSGFGKPNTPSSSPFAFLSNMSNNTPVKSNGLNSSTPVSGFKPPTTTELNTALKLPENGTKLSPFSSKSLPSVSATVDKSNLFDKNSTDYYAKLKGLNESVSQWIKTHVDKNPFCILTPIFKDYEKYLKEIDSNSDKKQMSEQKTTISDNKGFTFASEIVSTQSTSHTSSIFGNTTAATVESNIFTPKTVTSIEKPKEIEKSPFTSTVPTHPISFGTKSTSFSTPTSGFSFGSGAPFTFANVAKPASDNKPDHVEEEDDPPKVEFTPVVEDDNIFSKRCKVFVKKDGSFGDRGVGNMFLKPVTGSEKVQLIVRADTNLGNLLLNFILSESVPMQRMGKNNVMLVCIPTPDSKPPPVPVLLRVKTAEEADELLKILEKNKK